MSIPEDAAKELVAEAGAALVGDGMRVGLGTGTTVAHLLPLLPGRARGVTYFATSLETESAVRALGLTVEPFEAVDRLDLALDGADQVSPLGWLVKGGGGAHTREKIVAAAAERFVVLVSEEKLVDVLMPPIPLELLRFGVDATLRALAPSQLRAVAASPDGGLIADYYGVVGAPGPLADRLSRMPGVIEHGLFPPQLVSQILVASSSGVQEFHPGGPG
jgi:ribose 5-phosphate isomerase A